jgi:hypothetical protein
MEELFILILLIIVLLYVVYHNQDRIEGFIGGDTMDTETKEGAEGFEDAITLTACPMDMKTFYLSDGRTACCGGSVVGSRCTGNVQCTMTGDGTADLPNCGQLLKKELDEKSKTHCPSSMPSYFEDKSTKQKGCTAGALNSERTKPFKETQPKCTVYPTMEENLRKRDSCHFHKEMDDFPCFGSGCSKAIFSDKEGHMPPLVMIHFVDKSGMYRTAYTRKSLENYLNLSKPKWKDDGIDLDKNILVAEVAKAFYVDRSISQKDVQI